MKKGAMKTTPETAMSVLACSPAAPPAPPKPNRISITNAFLRKLSLSAEQSWHQNSGANLRDVIRLLNIAGLCRGARHLLPPRLSRNRGGKMNAVQVVVPELGGARRCSPRGHGAPEPAAGPVAMRARLEFS